MKRALPGFIFFCLTLFKLQAQTLPDPIARFTFNNKSDLDDINNRHAKLNNTFFSEDRFGNNNNAIFIPGRYDSYINLGNYAQIKPKVGSISLWVKIEYAVYWGKGTYHNPIILTKNTDIDDFYEAYAISYMLDKDRLNGICSKDSTYQASIHSSKKIQLNKWLHVVLTFDNDYVTLYDDSELNGRTQKNFETTYFPSDSVLVGVTGNKKNNRCSIIHVDDIEFYDQVLTAEQVKLLFQAPNPNRLTNIINLIILSVAFIAVGIIIYSLVRLRMRKQRERLELNNLLLETELRVNRALMNPHFIFNSLNALHNFILANENDLASFYLVKFSKLIRQNLESNSTGTTSLEIEMELLTKYLEIESLRFEKQINYSVSSDPLLIPSTTIIPIMMIQPFVENAIWHGLLKKQGEKTLGIFFKKKTDGLLECRIEDNGVGRSRHETSDTQKKSMATDFIIQRLSLLNKIYHVDCRLEIHDRSNNGTVVVITLPVLNTILAKKIIL